MLTRSAEKASGLEGAKLIVGDARDEIVLRQALEGRDAVISALGTPASPLREVTLLSTAVRPSMLNDKPGRDSIRALTDFSDFHGGTISRENVARFVLDQLRADVWLHRSPLITW